MKGGGKIDWASDIVSVLMNGPNQVVDYQMTEMFVSDDGKKMYYRLQAVLEPQIKLRDGAKDTAVDRVLSLDKLLQARRL